MTTINELLSDSRNSGQYRILNTLKPLFDDIESRLSSGGSGSSSGSSATFPIIYGGSAATSTLTLVSTSHASPSGSSGNTISFKTSGISRWTISRSGDFVPDTNNSYSIGELTSTASNIYLGGDIRFVDGSDYLKITRGTNSLLFGSATYALNSIYIGQGQTTTTPGTYAIRATGSAGAVAGGTIQIAAGVSGASGTDGGQIDFRTSSATGVVADGTTIRTRWSVVPYGHFIPFDTCSYDIGDSTHTVRHLYLCQNLKFKLTTRYGIIRWPSLTGVSTTDRTIDIPDFTATAEVDGKFILTNHANKFEDGLGGIDHIKGPDDQPLQFSSSFNSIKLNSSTGIDLNGDVRIIGTKVYENNELTWKIENFIGFTLASDHSLLWSSTTDAVNGVTDVTVKRFGAGKIGVSDDSDQKLTFDGNNSFIAFGIDNTFTGIKGSGTSMHIRLADDSAFAWTHAASFRIQDGTLGYFDDEKLKLSGSQRVEWSGTASSADVTDTAMIRSGTGSVKLYDGSTTNYFFLDGPNLAMQFGGTTSSFPALKRSATGIAVKLADDSGYGILEMASSRKWLSGSGSPESSVTSSVGGLYLRTDGASGTTLYVKESGTGNTGWTAIATGGTISGTENKLVKFGTGGSGAADSSIYDTGTLVQFGGQTSSFPALKRSSATLEIKLADDSGYAQATGSVIAATSAFQSSGSNAILKGEDGNTARSVTIRGSDAASGSNNGGNVIIRPGALAGAGSNGSFDLQTGGGSSRLAISTAGAVTAAGTWTHSGTLAFSLADGTKQISGPTTGGTILGISAGDRSTSGSGNALELYGGAANTTGTGGAVNIYAMDGVGSNQNGGSITLSAGVKTGAGTEGAINIGISTNRLGFFGVTAVARASAYTVTNGSTDRSYDANSTTLDEIADVVSTIIADLKNYGLFQ